HQGNRGGDPGSRHPVLGRARQHAAPMVRSPLFRARPPQADPGHWGSMMEDWFALAVLILSATLRVATPLILCALGALFCERSGLIDIGLEGKMLAAAFVAAAAASVTDSALMGLLAGILIAQLLALLHGFACITHRGNQVVSG